MPRYEFKEGASSKFWQIDLDGSSFTTTYGKIGTDGTSTLKEYDSEEKAQKEYDKLISEKTKKGYELVGGAKAAKAPPAAPAPAAKPTAAKVKAPAAAAPSGGGGGGKRYFEFVEGSSSKFWEVWIENDAVMTRYGRIGTDGQMTQKDEGSAASAEKLFTKLVGEKTKKGYVEK